MNRNDPRFPLLLKNTAPLLQTISAALYPLKVRGASGRKSNGIHGYISCDIL